MIVADTNLISYLMIEGERTSLARDIWRRDPHWLVPPLWRSEYLSVLTTTVRAQVLAPEQARAAWRAGVRLFGRSERSPDGEAVLDTALSYGISAYDAHFVTVAKDVGAHLVTADRKLFEACAPLALAPEEFIRASS